MGRYSYTIEIDAPQELVFNLWTDLELMKKWVGGVTAVSEPTGPIDKAGTTYSIYFGRFGSKTEVVEAERPRLYATKSGTFWMQLTNRGVFEPRAAGKGTRLTQTVDVYGSPLSRTFGWIFGHGSYRGSFLGELRHFGRIAEAEAAAQRGAS
jgi:Polyketide cyclase / dehydrase and lipid transport